MLGKAVDTALQVPPISPANPKPTDGRHGPPPGLPRNGTDMPRAQGHLSVFVDPRFDMTRLAHSHVEGLATALLLERSSVDLYAS